MIDSRLCALLHEDGENDCGGTVGFLPSPPCRQGQHVRVSQALATASVAARSLQQGSLGRDTRDWWLADGVCGATGNQELEIGLDCFDHGFFESLLPA